MGSLWFYMTASNGYPSMHSVIIGDWVGYGKWTGAVFGPSSKIINNECGGESRADGDIGGYESRRIKAFRFYSSFFGVKPHQDNEDDSSLSCSGFEYQIENQNIGYDRDWSQPEGACKCKPVSYPATFRHMDLAVYGDDNEWAIWNNKWNLEWCEELLRKNGGFGGHYGQWKNQCTA